MNALEKAISSIEEISDEVVRSLSEGSIPNRYRFHVSEWMKLWNEARNRIREAIGDMELLDTTRINDFVHKYLDPVLTIGTMILQKKDDLQRGEDLKFLESLLNDFTIRIKEFDAVPMALLSDSEPETSSISLVPSSVGGIAYFVYVSRDVASDCTRWPQAFHEPCHLVLHRSRTKEKVEEMFCDLLALRVCGYSYLNASIEHARNVDIDKDRGKHPPWRGRLESMFMEIASTKRKLSKEEKAVRSVLKDKWKKLYSSAGSPPEFYDVLMGGGKYEALARRRLAEIWKNRRLEYDGFEKWDYIVSRSDEDQLGSLSPVDLAGAITYRSLSGQEVKDEPFKSIMSDWS